MWRIGCSAGNGRRSDRTRSRRAGSWPRCSPGRVRRRLRQLGRGRHRRRAGRGRHERRVPRQGGARDDPRAGRRAGSHTAIFTHGHIDHVFGVDLYEEEARTNGWAPPRVDRARGDRGALRALRADRGLQRGDQPAAVPGAGPARGRPSTACPTRRTATRWRSPSAARRSSCFHDRGETDDATWVWSPGAQGAVRGRHVHLGVAQLRQPAEGAALRARLGGRVPQDGRARARGPAARSRAADRRRGARAPGAHRRRGAARVARRADARADERRRAPRRHRARGARARASARAPVPARRSTTSPSSSCATSGACTAAGTTAIRRT